VVFDRTENEPDEWDPEEEYYDPDSDGLTIPQVSGDDGPGDLDDLSSAIEPPEVEVNDADVPAELLQTFWALVLVLNAAVLAVSLGLLILLFEGYSTRVPALVVAGVVLFGFAVRRYRRFQADDSDDGSDAEPRPESDGGGSDTESASDDEASAATTPSDEGAETTSGSAAQEQSPNRDEPS